MLYLVAVGAVVSIATTLVVLVRYRAWSRPVAMAQGVTTVVGVGAVHVAPEWSHLADSYAAADADALSWLIILAMMLAGLALTIVAAQGGSLTGQAPVAQRRTGRRGPSGNTDPG